MAMIVHQVQSISIQMLPRIDKKILLPTSLSLIDDSTNQCIVWQKLMTNHMYGGQCSQKVRKPPNPDGAYTYQSHPHILTVNIDKELVSQYFKRTPQSQCCHMFIHMFFLFGGLIQLISILLRATAMSPLCMIDMSK